MRRRLRTHWCRSFAWLTLAALLACRAGTQDRSVEPSPRTATAETDCAVPIPAAEPWRELANVDGEPSGLAVGPQGAVWATLPANNGFVAEFSASGELLATWGSGKPSVYFHDNYGIATDGQGNIYTTDLNRHSVVKLSPGGQLLAEWGNAPFGFLSPVGDLPQDIAVDSQGYVYVTTGGGVAVLDPAGHRVATWEDDTGGKPMFVSPEGIAVDRQGNVYVTDLRGGAILKLSPMGKVLARWGSKGDRSDQFQAPSGIALDPLGRIYIADGMARVVALSPCGRVLRDWRQAGGDPGQFLSPWDVAVDPTGNHLYVSDTGNHRIQVLTLNGNGES